jgi:hypothetical protein
MKINPPSQINFTFGKDKEELYSQAEFFLGYYTARLKFLKAENSNLYITAEQAGEEIFYKDMISACMLFLNDKKTFKKTEDYEAAIRKCEPVSRDISPGEVSRTDISRRKDIPPSSSIDGRGEQ